MKLLDSNIIIYASQPDFYYLRPLLTDPASCVSEIVRLEVLGYHLLTAQARHWLEAVFSKLSVVAIEKQIIDEAVQFKQLRKMSVGDAINAATALVHQCSFYTRNTHDFRNLKGVSIVNPIIS